MVYCYKFKKNDIKKGFSIVEVILSAAIFCIFSAVALSFLFAALKTEQQGNQAEIALQYASEGIEAVRAIRNDSFDRLADTEQTGLKFSDDKWEFEGEYDEFENYQRRIEIITVRRNGDGDVVLEGGEEDTNMKKIMVTVFWNSLSGQEVSVEQAAYLSNWK